MGVCHSITWGRTEIEENRVRGDEGASDPCSQLIVSSEQEQVKGRARPSASNPCGTLHSSLRRSYCVCGLMSRVRVRNMPPPLLPWEIKNLLTKRRTAVGSWPDYWFSGKIIPPFFLFEGHSLTASQEFSTGGSRAQEFHSNRPQFPVPARRKMVEDLQIVEINRATLFRSSN